MLLCPATAGKSGSTTAAGKAAQSEGGKKGGKATAKKDVPAEKATNGKGGKDPSKTPGGKASGVRSLLTDDENILSPR